VGSELFHAGRQTDGRTDMTKLVFTFHTFAKKPENSRILRITSCSSQVFYLHRKTQTERGQGMSAEVHTHGVFFFFLIAFLEVKFVNTCQKSTQYFNKHSKNSHPYRSKGFTSSG
jgi:hypothetical protein